MKEVHLVRPGPGRISHGSPAMRQGLSHALGTLGVVAAIAVLGLARPVQGIEVSSAELFVDRILGVQEQYAISASLRIDSANPIQSVSLYSQAFAGSFPLARLWIPSTSPIKVSNTEHSSKS